MEAKVGDEHSNSARSSGKDTVPQRYLIQNIVWLQLSYGFQIIVKHRYQIKKELFQSDCDD
eukprot:UN06442